ncbi:MAG: LPS-assembly protein LptD [Bacteroidetes bacterium]|nr:LPS-assembly protein LptD [Bacteroidota bacterium]
MNKLRKFSLKYLFAGTLTAGFLLFLTWKAGAGYVRVNNFYSPLTSSDTLPVKRDTAQPSAQLIRDTIPVTTVDSLKKTPKDSLALKSDSLTRRDSVVTDTFSLKLSKDSLDAPVFYEAEDSAVVLIKDQKIVMYGKTKTDYKEITLTAPKVEMDQVTQIVTAIGSKDSAGEIIERADFKDGEQEFQSDSIKFNFKTQKGLTKNTFTQQGELFVNGQDIKKYNENTIFIKKGTFTTCNLDEPHFGFKANKMKVVNKKLAVSGPAHPEFEGVPIPIYIPFGFFPLTQGRHSGLLPPTFTTNDQFGIGLTNIGYYKVINDYWDVKLYGDIYSYGGWNFNINPTYRKRYKYSGSFTFTIQNTKYNFKGDPDFSVSRNYHIGWNHSVDSKAKPGTTFSANVNAGSTKYNRNVLNSAALNFQNSTSSSIAYSKTWQGKPYNLTASLNHSQNNSQHIINLSLPTIGFTVNTLYPFQPKEMVGTPKWYEKLGIGYTNNFRNQISFYDTVNSKRVYGKSTFEHLLDTLQWGGLHTIPISLSLPSIMGGSVVVSPSISFSQILISGKEHRQWNATTKRVDTAFTKGFFTDQTMSFGLNLSSALFGTYQFRKSKVVALRHVIRPTIGVSYKPDLSKAHWYNLTIDSTGRKISVPEFRRSMFGYYSAGRFGGLNFGFDNNLEMKVRTKDTTGENKTKKIRLIDGFGFSGSYNFFGDSISKLSPIVLYFRSTLFDKINITANSSLDPYQKDITGNRIGKYAWQGGKFSLGTINSVTVTMSTSFQSKPKDAKKDAERKQQMQQLTDPTLVADQQALLDYMRQNPAEFVDFNVPWTVNFGFSLNYSRVQRANYTYTSNITTNMNFGGSFTLTPKWNFSGNGYYDFRTMKMQTLTMSISRDLHCWQMAITVSPVGLYRTFSISINPKASVLQDLRINRNRSFSTAAY